ncbi:MAG: TetR/AcrR family transcriptional regulator C-terminal domain-containing protein [Anaerovoracaceae bacterium]
MTGLTKKAIRDSFIKILNEKPLSQITVRDIVDDCGVNRNTFYYHFHDIPELLETIVDDEMERMIREHPNIDSMQACFDAILEFALANKRAVMHIYHSVNREIYELYQWRICGHCAAAYIDTVMDGRRIDETDRSIIIDYVKCVLFGMSIGWLEAGMKEDISDRFHRLCQLKQGDLEKMLDRSEEKK